MRGLEKLLPPRIKRGDAGQRLSGASEGGDGSDRRNRRHDRHRRRHLVGAASFCFLGDLVIADPEFARRITVMMEAEPSAQLHTGITPQLKQYVIEAFGVHRLALYANYLDADELRHMREHGGRHGEEWIALLAKVHRHMQSGAAPGDPASQALAREWMQLFRARIGDNPETLAKIRRAHEQEPRLTTGTWATSAMLDFIRKACATLP